MTKIHNIKPLIAGTFLFLCVAYIYEVRNRFFAHLGNQKKTPAIYLKRLKKTIHTFCDFVQQIKSYWIPKIFFWESLFVKVCKKLLRGNSKMQLEGLFPSKQKTSLPPGCAKQHLDSPLHSQILVRHFQGLLYPKLKGMRINKAGSTERRDESSYGCDYKRSQIQQYPKGIWFSFLSTSYFINLSRVSGYNIASVCKNHAVITGRKIENDGINQRYFCYATKYFYFKEESISVNVFSFATVCKHAVGDEHKALHALKGLHLLENSTKPTKKSVRKLYLVTQISPTTLSAKKSNQPKLQRVMLPPPPAATVPVPPTDPTGGKANWLPAAGLSPPPTIGIRHGGTTALPLAYLTPSPLGYALHAGVIGVTGRSAGRYKPTATQKGSILHTGTVVGTHPQISTVPWYNLFFDFLPISCYGIRLLESQSNAAMLKRFFIFSTDLTLLVKKRNRVHCICFTPLGIEVSQEQITKSEPGTGVAFKLLRCTDWQKPFRTSSDSTPKPLLSPCRTWPPYPSYPPPTFGIMPPPVGGRVVTFLNYKPLYKHKQLVSKIDAVSNFQAIFCYPSTLLPPAGPSCYATGGRAAVPCYASGWLSPVRGVGQNQGQLLFATLFHPYTWVSWFSRSEQTSLVKTCKKGSHLFLDVVPLKKDPIKSFFKQYLLYLKKLISQPVNLPLPFLITKLNRLILSWKSNLYLFTLPETQKGEVKSRIHNPEWADSFDTRMQSIRVRPHAMLPYPRLPGFRQPHATYGSIRHGRGGRGDQTSYPFTGVAQPITQCHTHGLKKPIFYKKTRKYLESYKKKQQSQYLNFYICKLLWKLVKKRHPTQSNRWLFEKHWKFTQNIPYFYAADKKKNYFVLSFSA